MSQLAASRLEEVRRRFNRISRVPDPLSYIFTGSMLAAIGLILLAYSLELIDERDLAPLSLTSLGALLLLDAAARYRKPWTRYRSKPYAVIGASPTSSGILLGARLEFWWTAPLTVIGVALIAEGVVRLKRVGVTLLQVPETS